MDSNVRTDTLADVYSTQGVIARNRLHPEMPSGVSVVTADGIVPVACWLDDFAGDHTTLDCARVDLLRSESGALHLVRATRQADLDPLDLVPEVFLSDPSLLFTLRDHVGAIRTPVLRAFVSEVFRIPHVFYKYWTAPGEQGDAQCGGLLNRSLKAADLIQRALRKQVIRGDEIAPEMTDLAISVALLQGVGKCVAYEANGCRCQHAKALGTSFLSLELMRPALEWLAQRDAAMADAIRVLIQHRAEYADTALPLYRLQGLLLWAAQKAASG